ncbi:RNA polymerase subunit sigma, partial [bacterium]|nr:RNA polymerase subunit sigma [bacterium]
MEEELINMNTEEYENDSAISQLIEYGRQKSFVTIDDILRFFPDAEQDVDQLEEAFAALMNAGIQYTEETQSDDVDEEDLDLSDIDEEDEGNAIGLSDDLSNIDTDDTIGLYLKEVSRVPLLTADEEVELAQRIEKGRISREELARVNVTPERRLELRKNIEDSWAARDHLITANSRLVISVAKKYMGRGVPFLDLIQEGNIG